MGVIFVSSLNHPTGLAFDRFGNLYETDSGTGTIFEFDPARNKTTFAGGLNKPTGIALGPDGKVYVAESGTGTIYNYTLLSGGMKLRNTIATGLSNPQQIAFDSNGALFIANAGASPASGHWKKVFVDGGTFAVAGMNGRIVSVHRSLGGSFASLSV